MENLTKQYEHAREQFFLCSDIERFGILPYGGEDNTINSEKTDFWKKEVSRLERLLNLCPDCGQSWDDGDIAERLYETGYYRKPHQAEEAALNYGWTPENPTRFSKRLSIYSRSTDKTEANQCPFCNTIRSRWTEEVIKLEDIPK